MGDAPLKLDSWLRRRGLGLIRLCLFVAGELAVRVHMMSLPSLARFKATPAGSAPAVHGSGSSSAATHRRNVQLLVRNLVKLSFRSHRMESSIPNLLFLLLFFFRFFLESCFLWHSVWTWHAQAAEWQQSDLWRLVATSTNQFNEKLKTKYNLNYYYFICEIWHYYIIAIIMITVIIARVDYGRILQLSYVSLVQANCAILFYVLFFFWKLSENRLYWVFLNTLKFNSRLRVFVCDCSSK